MSEKFNSELNIDIKGLESIRQANEQLEELDRRLLSAADSAEKASNAVGAAGTSATQSKQQEKIATEEVGKASESASQKIKKAKAEENRLMQKNLDSLSNTRYALYDVAALYGSVSIAAGAFAAATAGVGMEYEKAFASVARTTMETGEALGNLRQDLIGLTQAMPTSFEDVSAIATLGAQLGIANKDIANFTETVAMFSATTDVSVERTGTAIGRLAQLTKTAGSEIDNLASAIYQTGITAVATEGEILSVAEQIATAGDLAGLTNYQIIALASSLASLGVAPESARGSLMRIFDTIERGADSGGEALQKIAQISGMSSADIQKNWGTDSQKVFTAFINGLGAMQDAGVNTNAMMKDLGISAVRDIRALQLLANNTEVYAQALTETESAYRKNTALTEGYAIGTDTLVDQLERLKNNLKAIVGQGSDFNNFMKGAVSVINEVLQVVSKLAGSKIGSVLIGTAAAIAVAVGAWASFHVAINLARGGLAAFITAQAGLQKAGVPLQLGLAGIAKEFFAVATGGEAAVTRLLATGSAMDKTAVSANRLQATLATTKSVAGAMGKGLMAVTRFVAPIAAISAVLWAGEKAWTAWSNSRMSATEKAEKHFGDLGGLAQAIAEDTKNGDDSVRSMTVAYSESTDKLAGWATAVQNATGVQVEMNAVTTETTEKAKTATVAIGELSRAVMAQMIVDETLETWKKYGDILGELGINANNFTTASIAGTAADLLDSKMDVIKSKIDAAQEIINLNKNADDVMKATFDRDAAYAQKEALDELANAYALSEGAIESASRTAAITGDIFEAAGVQINTAGDDAEDASGGFDTLSGAIDRFFDSTNREINLNQAIDNLGASLYENGTAFDTFTEGGIANMQSLRGAVAAIAEATEGDAGAFVGNIFAMLEGLQAQGVVVGEEMDWVFQLLNQVAGSQYGINFNTQAARENIHKFIADLITAQRLSVQAMGMQLQNTTFMAPEHKAQLESAYAAAEARLEGLVGMQNQLADSTNKSADYANKIGAGYNNAARGANDTAKGAGKAAKNAKEMRKEIRTSADYAKDLAGVFDEITDIVFGLRDAKIDIKETFNDILAEFIGDANSVSLDLFSFDRKEAKDGITKMFLDLQQAAKDAQDEVRDATLAVQDAVAELNSLSADQGTLEVQLEVAKALGNTERIASLEAKIAQNKSDQAQAARDLADAEQRRIDAINSTSTTTSGNSGVAIENRAELRDLAKEYMAYADMLREAGVSEKTISAYLEQSRKDYLAQGKALGYTEGQLKPYLEGIDAMSGDIKKNSTALKGNEKQVTDLYQAHLDSVAAFAATGASQKAVAKFAKDSEKAFFDQAKQLGYNRDDLVKYKLAWDGVHKTIATLPSNVTIRTNVNNPSDAPLRKFMTEWNNKQISMKANVGNPSSGSLKKWMSDFRKNNPLRLNVVPSGDGASAGKDHGNKYGYSWIKAVTGQRKVRPIKDSSVPGGVKWQAYNAYGQKVGNAFFRKGGYTGNGNPNDAAGIVHKQEYVFPAEATDPTTGLPRPEALIAMLGRTVGSLPFMAGGQQLPAVPSVVVNSSSNSGNGITVVELMPHQIAMIGEVVARNIPDNPILSQITDAVNQVNSTRSGKGQG